MVGGEPVDGWIGLARGGRQGVLRTEPGLGGKEVVKRRRGETGGETVTIKIRPLRVQSDARESRD